MNELASFSFCDNISENEKRERAAEDGGRRSISPPISRSEFAEMPLNDNEKNGNFSID